MSKTFNVTILELRTRVYSFVNDNLNELRYNISYFLVYSMIEKKIC